VILGKTNKDWHESKLEGAWKYAWLPVILEDGRWAWLQKVYKYCDYLPPKFISRIVVGGYETKYSLTKKKGTDYTITRSKLPRPAKPAVL